ncbi:hypothetical protein BYT27DRAFT_6379021 [Phlegmacium glaucopus]|nr:hypothetical protein BYT27DRAFT_6379021 [Phlegmacium glaucopus]
MRLWDIFLRLLSSPQRLIHFCWRALFNRERPSKQDDEEALISSPPVVPKRKALLLGIAGSKGRRYEESTTSSTEGGITSVHRDVTDMRQVLIDIYCYNAQDITVLTDDGDPENVQPTEENIIKEMGNLVADARPGDRFYFHYSGHGTQLADDNDDEEDGWDECILTSENTEIRDDTLKKIMVDPLPPGCSFVSVFDACHSGTLLDLTHYRCNRVYVPWVSKGIPRVDPLHDSAQHRTHLSLPEHDLFLHSPTTLSAEEAAGDILVPHGPHRQFCKGTCREESYIMQNVFPVADVISLSAAKDYQLSWGDTGSSLTQALVKVLRDDKNPKLTYLLQSVSHELHKFYLHLHPVSHKYRRWLQRRNLKLRKQGKAPEQGRKVETENFQDPQISSHQPLSEDKQWEL